MSFYGEEHLNLNISRWSVTMRHEGKALAGACQMISGEKYTKQTQW